MKVFDAGKGRMIGLPCGEKTDDMLSRFHLIPERNEQTDRRTDRFAILITRVNVPTRDIDIAILSVCPSVCLSVRPSVRNVPIFVANRDFYRTLAH